MNNIQRNFYYVSNFVPLWTGSYTFDKQYLTYRVIDYMNKFRLDKYVGKCTLIQIMIELTSN